jgi:4-amino-4-deoxy-L-arabinose transferase-like glycosyltransferase
VRRVISKGGKVVRGLIKRHWPLIVAIGALWIVVALWLMFSLSLNQGHLVYSLDDTYLHMAIAKNFTQHGVWGMTRYAFSSSSSSLLWTLSLSLVYLLFGVNEVAPLMLNLIFATLLICLVYGILKRYKLSSCLSIVVLGSMIFLAALPSLIFSGLEHILHIFLTIVFIYLFARTLSNQSSPEKKPPYCYDSI